MFNAVILLSIIIHNQVVKKKIIKLLSVSMKIHALILSKQNTQKPTKLRFLYGLHSTRHHIGCQGTFANSKLQMICNIDHTWVTSCVCPSWFASKTYSFLYVTDFVFTVSWTLLITFIPIYSGPFTAWNEQIKLRFFDTLVIFQTLFYVNLIIVCTHICILYFFFSLKNILWTVE